MAEGLLTAEEVRERLRAACAEAGSQGAFARRHGISAGVLSEILSGDREPSSLVLQPLGLRRHQRLYAPVGAWSPEDLYDPESMTREEQP